MTIFTEARLSQLNPCWRRMKPSPPPRVSPPIPVFETRPPGAARPWGCVGAAKVTPGGPAASAGKALPSASTLTLFSSTTIDDDAIVAHGEPRLRLWPPERTAIGAPTRPSEAHGGGNILVEAGRTIKAGRRRIAPFPEGPSPHRMRRRPAARRSPGHYWGKCPAAQRPHDRSRGKIRLLVCGHGISSLEVEVPSGGTGADLQSDRRAPPTSCQFALRTPELSSVLAVYRDLKK